MAEDSIVIGSKEKQPSPTPQLHPVEKGNVVAPLTKGALRSEDKSNLECNGINGHTTVNGHSHTNGSLLLNGHGPRKNSKDPVTCNGHTSETNQLENSDHAVNGRVNGEEPHDVEEVTKDEMLKEVANNLKSGGSISQSPSSDDSDHTLASSDSSALSTPPEELPPGTSTPPTAEPETKEAGREEASSKVEDVIVIQDPTFTVKIVPPGAEAFDLQVSPQEMVQEIHQVLMDREDTCHRTCFSLQLEGVVLDNFAELKSIDGLKEGSVIKVVEEPYTVREARIHVRHVRDLLKSLDPSDAYNGVDCQSLSFLTTILNDAERKSSKSSGNDVDCTPPDYIMPGSKKRPLVHMLPLHKEQKSPHCIKVLTLSGWNPPPGTRKMHGDLMYLYIVTMEGSSFHVTASTRGFYINQSTQEAFIPKPAEQRHLSHSLIELLNKISPTFKKTFSHLLKKRSQKHPYERVPTPFQTYSWVAPQLEHTVDSIRAEEAYTARLGYEEHIPGQTRDWNEELQTTRELPRKNLPERLLRERAVFKVHSDFVAAATRGAMAVIDGNVMAINPGEDTKMQMFIWNNIFFSLGFDVRDHYKEFGGDHAAYVAPSNDLQGVKAYNNVDLEGLYTLGTVVVDYRGYRITAQSIIPGILEREQEESVIYGSIDFGKTVVSCEKYKELLSKTAQHLKILPHPVINHKNEEVEIYTSIECKGIKGNDGRNYILDLLRTFPPDVNFLPIEGEELSEDVKQLSFPRQHRHKLCCLRSELIETFVENKYMLFIRHAAFMLMQKQSTDKKVDQSGKPSEEEDKKLGMPKMEMIAEPIDEGEEVNEKVEAAERSLEIKGENDNEKDSEQMLRISTESKDSGVSSETSVSSLSEENISIRSSDGDTKDAEKVKEERVLSEGEQKCPVLKELSESVGQEIVDGVDPATQEAAKALINSPAKETFDANHKEVIAKAALAAGSLSEKEFDMRFNPDVYAEGVTHSIHDQEVFQKQKKLIRDAAKFLLTNQIPLFIRECLEHQIAPLNGQTLIEMLHQRGINVRYLGVLAGMVSNLPQLCYLYRLAISEILIRSVKHLFKTYMQNVGMINLATAISHFLNCFLGSNPNLSVPKNEEELPSSSHHGKKKKNKKKLKYISSLGYGSSAWTNMTPSDLWNNIKQEAKDYFYFTLECEGTFGADSFVAHHHLQKVTLLREFASSVGIQLHLREYDFESKLTFYESDILNMFPKVKHINPTASDAYNFYQSGQNKIQQGAFREGLELISEALNLFNNVYGPMHAEIASCLRMLARLHYLMGEPTEAIDMQQKAVMMSERCNGIDHPNTITEYMHLALYCFASGQAVSSLKLMYRARYLALIIFGEDHPEMAQFDSNIGLVLHGVSQFDLSLKFLEKALENNLVFHGPKSLKAALSYHLVARVQSCRGDFRAALMREKDAYSIYKEQLGEEHDKTKESSECLTYLTQQAVTMQRTMNELRKNGPRAAMRPIPITPPSPSSVLETLNIINGIFLIPISGLRVAQKSEATVTSDSDQLDQTSSDPKAEVIATEGAEGTIPEEEPKR
ncbi:Clustered mitochondria protein-like [Holothuria leucospilota]|uniref:Clustered mitochondria protein homolog n=1 Tax=Holothuria leucospilota TaxID=206669 RepID=A0A9Q1HGE4_HOLLE|nr:Clustered mitochondria protein-like [Holothuria leucospilota]